MKYFSIRELEHFSGIKAHTIRIWEKRFQVLSPHRTPGNTRYYTIEDLEYLLILSFLNNNGWKISALRELQISQLNNILNTYTKQEEKVNIEVIYLIISHFASNVEQFELRLNSCVKYYGIDATIHNIIIPFLEKTGILNYDDNSNETHFAVTAIRRKLIMGIESAVQLSNVNKKALLFLPEGEHYDLILLYMTYVLKSKGVMVYYLGTNISDQNIQSVARAKNPDYLYVYTHSNKDYDPSNLLNFIGKYLPTTKLLITTSGNVNNPGYHLPHANFIHFKDIVKELN